MVRVDKCPNCGAFLPPRRPGVIRRCEYCSLGVGGHTQIVEVPALTVEDAVRLKLEEMRQAGRYAPPPPPVLVPPSSHRGMQLMAWGMSLLVIGIGVGTAYCNMRKVREQTAAAAAGAPPSPAPGDPLAGRVQGLGSGAKAALDADLRAAGGLTRFDAMKYLERLASRTSTYELRSLHLGGVRASGQADLTREGASVVYGFAPRDPPPGQGMVDCGATLTVSTSSAAELVPDKKTAASCKDAANQAIAPPACSPQQVWAKAVAKGAQPSQIADLELARTPGDRSDHPHGTWKLVIAGGLSLEVPDDCTAASPSASSVAAEQAGKTAAADAKASAAALASLRKQWKPVQRKLGACLARTTGGQDSVLGARLTFSFEVDARGHVRTITGKAAALINGIYTGDSAGMEQRMTRCAGEALIALDFPRGSESSYQLTARVAAGSGEIADGELRKVGP